MLGPDLTIIHSCSSNLPPSPSQSLIQTNAALPPHAPFSTGPLERRLLLPGPQRKHVVQWDQVLLRQPVPAEAPGARGRGIHVRPMPDHAGPGGPGSGQHTGGRRLRPLR